MRTNIRADNLTLAGEHMRSPVARVDIDAGGLSDDDILSLRKYYFENFADDGGTGATEGFLSGVYDSAGTAYTDSCLGVWDYDDLGADGIIIAGAYQSSPTQWTGRIKRISDPTVDTNWTWSGATEIGPYTGSKPKSCMTWYIGDTGAGDDSVGVVFAGSGVPDATSGFNNDGYIFATEKIGDILYVGGGFTEAFGITCDGLISYNTATDRAELVPGGVLSGGDNRIWQIGDRYDGDREIRTMAQTSDGRYLYVGGYFSHIGNILCNGVARYDTVTKTWSALGTGIGAFVSGVPYTGTVFSIHIDSDDNVWIAGSFDSVFLENSVLDTTTRANFAIWNHSQGMWQDMSAHIAAGTLSETCFEDFVRELYVVGDTVYACGNFDHTFLYPDSWYPPDYGPPPAPPAFTLYGLAKRTGADGVWEPLITGGFTEGGYRPTAFAVSNDEEEVYVSCGGMSIDEIWHGDISKASWVKLADALTAGDFWSLTVASDDYLYVTGSYEDIDGTTTLRKVCYYDVVGTTWYSLGTWPTLYPVIIVEGMNYISSTEIYIYGKWDDTDYPTSAKSSLGKWDGSVYVPFYGLEIGISYARFINFTTLSGALVESQFDTRAEILSRIKPPSKDTGVFPITDEAIGIVVRNDGYNSITPLYFNDDSGEILYREEGTYPNVFGYSCPMSAIAESIDSIRFYVAGNLDYNHLNLPKSSLYSMTVSNIWEADYITTSPPVLSRVANDKFLSVDVCAIDVALQETTITKYLFVLDYQGTPYTDTTGEANIRWRELVSANLLTDVLSPGQVFETINGGLSESASIPGTRVILNDGDIYTVGGLGTGVSTPYGPHLIKSYNVVDLLEISDSVTSVSLSHSGPNTAAQVSLTVGNEYGQYNATTLMRLGTMLNLYLGYEDDDGNPLEDQIGRYEIRSINNEIEFGKQVISVEASDLLSKLNDTQHASEDNSYLHYEGQIITNIPFKKHVYNEDTGIWEPEHNDPFLVKNLVPLAGNWQYGGSVSDSYIYATNPNDSGAGNDESNQALHPILHLAAAGATVGEVDIYFSLRFDGTQDDSRGYGGVILAGNPESPMEDSLVLVIDSGDVRGWNAFAAIGQTVHHNVTNPDYRFISTERNDDYFVNRLSTHSFGYTFYNNAYRDFMVRKTRNTISLFMRSGTTYQHQKTWNYTFQPQWYIDNNYKGNIGIYATPHRGRDHTARTIFFKGLFAHSLTPNITATSIMQEIADQVYDDEVDLESGFEKRFFDNFDGGGAIDTEKWHAPGGSIIVDSTSPTGTGYVLNMPVNSAFRMNTLTGHNRHYTVKLKNASVDGSVGFWVRHSDPSVGFRAHYIVLTKTSGYYTVRVYKYEGASGFLLRTVALSTVPVGAGYHTYTITTAGNYCSAWMDGNLLTTFVIDYLPGYKFDITNDTLVEYYWIQSGGTNTLQIAEVKNHALDLVITGLEGVVGFTINPGDFYGAKFAEIAETCAGLYYMRGNTLVAGRLVSETGYVDVDKNAVPWDFDDQMTKYSTQVSTEDWFTAVQTIGGDGIFGPLITDTTVPDFQYGKIYYHFLEGITDETQLYDAGKFKLAELKRNRSRETFVGYAQLALDLRDRVDLQVYRTPHDDSTPLDVDISRLVNSYAFNFSRTDDSVDLSMDIELVEA